MAGSAVAQTPASKGAVNGSTTVGEVVVTARKSPIPAKQLPAVVWKDVIVRAQPAHTGNLSRWRKAVCPGVFGLTPAYASFVAKRITEVTRDFTPPRPVCRRSINLMVVFTTTPQAVMDDVRDYYPVLLGYHYLTEEKKLATFQGPLEAWYVTATNGVLDDPYGPRLGVSATGRLRNGAADEFWFVLVVVDATAIEDQPVGAVADHIAAVALSKTGIREGCSPLPSILDALDPACRDSTSAQTLTAYDRSLLKALYATDPEQVGQAERGSIALHVLRDLKAKPEMPRARPVASTSPPP